LPVLQEWCRVLKPGGRIKLNLPDFEWCIHKWLSLPESERWGYPLSMIFGTQCDPGQIHYTAFTHARVKSLLDQAGFVDITTRPIEAFDMQCIWAEAVKPAGAGQSGSRLSELETVSRTAHYYNNPLPGVDYNVLETNELKRQVEVLTQHKDELVKAFKMLEAERDLYKARWNKLVNFPLLKPLFAIRHLLKS